MGGGAKPVIPQPDAADSGFVGTAMKRASATAAADGVRTPSPTAEKTGRTAIARDPRKRTGDAAAPIATPAAQSASVAAATAAAVKARQRAGSGFGVLGKPY